MESLESKKKRRSLSPSTPGPSPSTGLRLLPANLDSDVIINSGYQLGIMEINQAKELGACCNSPFADVEAKISGSNVILKTISKRFPGQIVKIIQVFEGLALEITHLNISSMDDTVLYSFVLKVKSDVVLISLVTNNLIFINKLQIKTPDISIHILCSNLDLKVLFEICKPCLTL